MNKESINKREISIDLLRIVSCFLIILRHVTDNYELINDHWRTAIILKSISYPALPIFIMITGYFIFDKEESYGSFFKKKFTRIFLPFLCWSFIYYQYFIQFTTVPIKRNFIFAFLSDGISYHLWYVYFITGVYIVAPAIGKMCRSINIKDLIYLVALWIITTSVFPIIKTLSQIDIRLSFIFQNYWGYILGGYLIKRLINNKKYFMNSFFIVISIYLLSIIGTICFNHGEGMILDYLNIFSISMIILCFSSFYLVKYSNFSLDKFLSMRIKKVIINVSNLTYTIYLAHALILDAFLRGTFGLRLNPRFVTPIFGVILLTFLIFIICLVISLLESKLNILLGSLKYNKFRINILRD